MDVDPNSVFKMLDAEEFISVAQVETDVSVLLRLSEILAVVNVESNSDSEMLDVEVTISLA